MKTVLVTGGAGFIGSHLCERLLADGHKVISLDNYFTGTRENHMEGVEYREGHTKDIEKLIPEEIDLVYHLGEYSRTEKSFEDLEFVWDLNKTGTFAVLEFVRRRGSKIVYAGSSTKFADGGLGRNQSPYAWTKASNTELVKNYADWFNIKYAITYFYNVYGPRERAGAYGTVIEIFKQNYINGRALTITSPGTQQRNFTHVKDIVDGLVIVGENGEGDEFGLGDARVYSILEVAKLFGNEIVMLPERAGNRMQSEITTEKANALGWVPKRHLAEYIKEFKKTAKKTEKVENRILVFTTTFHPFMGPAEHALCQLMKQLPDIQFDIITAAHSPEAWGAICPVPNATVHHVGWGTRFDKYFLPVFGARKGHELSKKHQYLFSWSLMASYGAIAALLVRRVASIPLLITLADQKIGLLEKIFLGSILGYADQIYASTPEQNRRIVSLAKRMSMRTSLGAGDAFANQIRFAYATILSKVVHSTLNCTTPDF